MELSLRLDTLGIAEMRYLRGRERYRDWAPFLLLAASRQARVFAYLSRDVVEQLHQQILAVEEATGLGADDEDDDEEENNGDEADEKDSARSTERENSPFSPALAQTLEKLNDLARQRLPDASGSVSQTSGELAAEPEGEEAAIGEEDALEQSCK